MELLSRRDLVRHFGLAGLAAAFLPSRVWARPVGQDRILLGDGAHKYEWIPGWAKLPEGMKYVGSTHGNVGIDANDRVYINTDTENAVMVFESDGKYVKGWGKEVKGAHGMKIAKEGDKEVLWLCSLSRSEVLKCTLDGEILMTIPFPEKSGVYKSKGEYKPTGVCIGPNGDVYVGDGYGKSWVHQWNAKGEYLRSWNGSEREKGAFRTPHGMCLDLRGKDPLVAVADRGNGRIQWFTLDGKFVTEAREGLRAPCTLYIRGEDIVIPDLQGRVTILNKDNKLVAHMGETQDKSLLGKNPVKPEQWVDGQFIAPHGAAWDSKGDLYVEDWNATGRVNKLKRLA